MIQQEFNALVGVFGTAVAGQLPPGKGPSPVHVGMNPAGERLLAGIAQIGRVVKIGVVERRIQKIPRGLGSQNHPGNGLPIFQILRSNAIALPLGIVLPDLIQGFPIV